MLACTRMHSQAVPICDAGGFEVLVLQQAVLELLVMGQRDDYGGQQDRRGAR